LADIEMLAADVPGTVRDLIEQLRRRLDADDAMLLGGASVVGRRFSAAAVAAALADDEGTVEARCDELARTGVFIDQVGTEEWPDGTVASRYAFDHDLHAEVLYDLLPAGQRARMHARVGERLEAAFGTDEHAAALLASHFVRAREPAKAVPHLGRAAEQALRRNAHREAAAHLTEALGLLDRLPRSRGRDEQELGLLTTLGTAQITLGGYASPEAATTYRRARAVSTRLGDGAYLLPVLYGLWNNAIVGARHAEALAIGEDFLRLAEELGDDGAAAVAARAVGLPLFFRGRFAEARRYLERAVAPHSADERTTLLNRYGESPDVAGLATLAWQQWLLGRPEQGASSSAASIATAREIAHPFTLVYALTCGMLLHHFGCEPATAAAYAEEVSVLAEEHEITLFAIWASIGVQWARAIQREADAAAPETLRATIDAATATGALAFRPYWLSFVAEVEQSAGDVDRALTTVGEALEGAAATDERFWEAELHRQRGELELQTGDEEAAAVALARAVEIARAQGARSLELRAAVTATAVPGAADSARTLVADLYAAFEEGQNTVDLAAAREALGVAAHD
jgi:predicted ATPase